MIKEWTFRYSYTPEPEVEHDVFHCEAETEEEAQAKFDEATAELEDLTIEKVSSKDYVDPNQMKLFEEVRP